MVNCRWRSGVLSRRVRAGPYFELPWGPVRTVTRTLALYGYHGKGPANGPPGCRFWDRRVWGGCPEPTVSAGKLAAERGSSAGIGIPGATGVFNDFEQVTDAHPEGPAVLDGSVPNDGFRVTIGPAWEPFHVCDGRSSPKNESGKPARPARMGAGPRAAARR